VFSAESTCGNHIKCEDCALVRCCPVKLDLWLREVGRERESKHHRWLNVDIFGFDRRTNAKVREVACK
jgi:hypothetical protein